MLQCKQSLIINRCQLRVLQFTPAPLANRSSTMNFSANCDDCCLCDLSIDQWSVLDIIQVICTVVSAIFLGLSVLITIINSTGGCKRGSWFQKTCRKYIFTCESCNCDNWSTCDGLVAAEEGRNEEHPSPSATNPPEDQHASMLNSRSLTFRESDGVHGSNLSFESNRSAWAATTFFRNTSLFLTSIYNEDTTLPTLRGEESLMAYQRRLSTPRPVGANPDGINVYNHRLSTSSQSPETPV